MSLLNDLRAIGLSPTPQAPLAPHTFWRIGGPAELLVRVDDLHGLQQVMALPGPPPTVLGGGSNVLVADKGVTGMVLTLGGALRRIELGEDADGAWVEAGAGARNAALLSRVDRAGLHGLAPLVGVPGTAGGALRMNAGTVLGEVGSRLIRATVVLPRGEVEVLRPVNLRLGYRTAHLPPGAVIASVRLRLERDGLDAARTAARHHLARRKATQPLDQPSCGSVFRNPPGDHAGRLIEAAGLKGQTAGAAQISPRHANFIVNTGGATASDVYRLLLLIRGAVHERFGVTLEPEVHPMGAWPPGAWPLPDPASA